MMRRQVRNSIHQPYQSYTVDDYLKKMGVDITKGVDAGGADKQDRE